MSASFETVKSVIGNLKGQIDVSDITLETRLEDIGVDPLSAGYGDVIGLQIDAWSPYTGSKTTLGEFWIGEGPYQTVGDIVADYGALQPSYQLIRNW